MDRILEVDDDPLILAALSRILRVGELPEELLAELATFERLSRTHLEELAPPFCRRGRGGGRSSARRENATATATGPMNSIVTQMPSGMRSSAS